MDRAIQIWVIESNSSHDAIDSLASCLKLTYTIYGCMLLLSPNSFQSPAWQTHQNENPVLNFERLYELISHHLIVTHIAVNKPIPALENDESTTNVVRSPTHFRPLYGDFGPDSASSPPKHSDFDAAFWVTAKQNGIFQTWAPRWTMFSRGNISEKARLLTLPSVTEAVEQGKLDGRACAAVDLYAGIGYFAFSYLKAGVEKVFCWDLNPWSIEGLRRGADANKWSSATFWDNSSAEDLIQRKTRLLVFNEANEHAPKRISYIRKDLPAIRHVNCGLLPTSRDSWRIAVEILDCKLGGWMHVHENFAIAEIEERAEEVRASIQQLALETGRAGTVKIDYVNRLKSYAPGVMHCVLDIYIPPNPSTN